MKRLMAGVAALAACACTSAPADVVETENDLTPEQQIAYEKCLKDNMAVAVAWEIIEARCLEEAQGEAWIDPLQVKG